ncbi:MAG: prepilin-type N-terminal cleavage/methylation domain-containing protein [Deltaproteobacteria bacterium]|nr:prepilin-type N-terminal cleavage/methylation domain-containing protein [Deltaproteobacteria bacterium]MBI2342036.1 prepilin-type N-terminal cleavage/methylation domain-containing protein [Deltaproteobacteria bacterium]MBI2973986.1 prepilin-type N-terminal cleavage/methylation domain-containing protein [Deltaproteobacteria bacterium]
MNFANKNKGFTLIEAVLTIVIISSGLFGMMLLFDNITRGAIEGDMNITASYVAREKLEQMVFDKVYKGYDYVQNGNYNINEPVLVGNHNYTRQTNIYEVSKADLTTAEAGSGFKRIDMTVLWGSSATQKITESTLLTNY